MTNRLEEALQFNRGEIQAGIDEAQEELRGLRDRAQLLEELIKKGRQLLEGGTADFSSGPNGQRLTLHEAIRQVLLDRDNAPTSARELADEINARELYRKRDGSPVEVNQIHARINNYGTMFKKVGTKIHLRG